MEKMTRERVAAPGIAAGVEAMGDAATALFRIAPNQTKDRVFVQSSGPQIESYTITDALGKIHTCKTNLSYGVSVDMSGFPPGVYSLRINGRYGSYKIIKQ